MPRSRDVLRRNLGGICAISSAVLFGASTPFAKLLLSGLSPQLLAGLLYLGSGIGLGLWLIRPGRRAGLQEAKLASRDLPWLAASVLTGGVAAPLLLMWGLSRTAASAASLLLNLEGALTAALAWFIFREHFSGRTLLGVTCIVAGGILLSGGGIPEVGTPWGGLAVAGACLCWALDNNLTRTISAADPVQIAAIKGLCAGATNIGLAVALGAEFPDVVPVLLSSALGFLGYGVSLVFFIVALRHLGSARTSAYFSTGPFVGSAVSIALLGESATPAFLFAGSLMGLGVLLHMTEVHSHVHDHSAMTHDHWHTHDEHHRHEHAADVDSVGPHSHEHVHHPLRHSHPHHPDIHHQHPH